MDISFSLLGLLYIALLLWAILSIAQSHDGLLSKALWLIIVLALQPIGAIIWLFIGPRACPSRRRRYHP